MGHIQGSSEWREFSLPFTSSGQIGPPTKVVLNVVLAGRGTVELGPIRIVQHDGPWWSWQIGAVIGAGGDSLLGIFCGLIGALAGLGKTRRLVLLSMQTIFMLGLVEDCSGAFGVSLLRQLDFGQIVSRGHSFQEGILIRLGIKNWTDA